MRERIPPTSEAAVRRAVIPVFALTLAGTLAWLSAIFLAPYLKGRSPAASAFLYSLFSPVCHQIPSRSFTFGGYPLAVCGRCLGIYTGFLAGLVIYPFARGFSRISLPRARLFLLLSVPVGLDFAGGFVRIWASPIGLRFAVGALWGILLPFYFITGVSELVLWRSGRKKEPGPSPRIDEPALDSPRRKNIE
jgi:uncharacterized membrane protein